jgi:hypothetical protein
MNDEVIWGLIHNISDAVTCIALLYYIHKDWKKKRCC